MKDSSSMLDYLAEEISTNIETAVSFGSELNTVFIPHCFSAEMLHAFRCMPSSSPETA